MASSLGKAGLLGAAGLVGYEFGSWLNTTFKLDEKINDLIDKMNGVDRNRATMPGLQAGGDQYLGDGTVKDSTGAIKKYGKDPAKRFDIEARYAFVRNQKEIEGVRMTPGMRMALASTRARLDVGPQIVGPHERAVMTSNETTTTNKQTAEITIKDETGRASVTKKTKGKVSLKLQQSGAF